MRNLVILGLISFTFVASRNHTDLPLNITSTVQNVTEAVTQTTDEPTTTTEDYNKHSSLGERCTYNHQCIVAFAICKNETCQCQATFKAVGKDKCLPSVFSCPHKGIISGKPVLCHVYADPSTNGFLPADVSKSEAAQHQRHNSVVDSCPKGFFCALHDRNTVGTGHCCPQDVFWCPVGQPELNRSCDSGDPNIPFCNYDTHECHQVSLNGRNYQEICCPKPCPTNQILRRDRCWPTSRLGEACELNDQCQDSHAECRNRTCVCQKHHYLNDEGRSCERAYCSYSSDSKEPLVDAQGDIIRCNTNTSVCVGNSYCSSNGYICCPTPAAKCSGSDSDGAGEKNKHVCDTSLANNCPSGQSCQSWIQVASRTGPNNERIVTQNLGICC